MTTTSPSPEVAATRPNPISFRPDARNAIDARLRQVADEQDRAVNWVVNDVLNKGLPPLRNESS